MLKLAVDSALRRAIESEIRLFSLSTLTDEGAEVWCEEAVAVIFSVDFCVVVFHLGRRISISKP